MKDNVLIICPKFFPKKDGLSGYTTKLSVELANQFNIDVLTSKEFSTSQVDQVTLFPLIGKWKFLELFNNSRNLLKNNYQHIFIQYVPTLYGKKGGINFSILLFFLYLRIFQKAKISVMFHELYFPFSFYWKAIILNVVHKIMLFFTLLSSHKAFFSTERFLNEAKYFTLNHSKLTHLPVGDNLFFTDEDSCKFKLDQSKTNLIIFGSAHPSKNYDLVLETLSQAYKVNSNIHLTIIGPTSDELSKNVTLPKDLETFTTFLPKLEDKEVQNIFKQGDLLISYFIDGLTTRRSSIISSLAYGLPVISTKSNYTEKIFYNREEVRLFDTDPTRYKNDLLNILSTESLTKANKEIREKTSKFHDEYFCWSHISKIIKENWT